MWPDRRLLDLFKTEFPIVLAPMAGIMDADLVIAAAQGGALGSLPCAMISVEKAREQINTLRQRVSAPVNMNFFCHKAVDADPAREAGWKQRLASYYKEFGLDPALPSDAAMCELVEELKPEVVSCHFGLPDPALLRRVKAAGCIVISSATIVREAIWLEENGADAIIAQGAGGRRPSRDVFDREYRRAARHLRAGAAGGRCGESPRDRGGRHRRRPWHRGGVRAGCGRRADRQRLSALPGIQRDRTGARCTCPGAR